MERESGRRRKKRKSESKAEGKQDAVEGARPLAAPSGRGERGARPRTEVRSRAVVAAAEAWEQSRDGVEEENGGGVGEEELELGARMASSVGPLFIGAVRRCEAADILRPRRFFAGNGGRRQRQRCCAQRSMARRQLGWGGLSWTTVGRDGRSATAAI